MAASLDQIQQAIDSFDFDKARDLLREELRERPSADAYYLASLIADGDIQHNFFLEKALSLDPNHPKALAALGQSKPVPAKMPEVQTVKPEAASQQAQINKPKTRRKWQKFISVGIVLAFFAPWLRSCGPDVSGFGVVSGLGSSILGEFTNPTDSLINLLLGLLFFLSLISILAYCLLNFYTTFIKIKEASEYVWNRLMLILSGAGFIGLSAPLIISLFQSTSGDSLGGWLWGYWLTWLGITFSALLDARAYFMSRRRIPTVESVNPPPLQQT